MGDIRTGLQGNGLLQGDHRSLGFVVAKVA